jgi:tRNA-dihydrouridine synthase B
MALELQPGYLRGKSGTVTFHAVSAIFDDMTEEAFTKAGVMDSNDDLLGQKCSRGLLRVEKSILKIGNVSLPVPFMLAPMAGVSDLPFRMVTRSFGAPLAFTEMIDAKAISHRDRKTLLMLSSTPADRPLGIQLLGNDETSLLKALDALEDHEFDLLDFNAACPTPKVTRKGKGAALLKEPQKLGKLLKVLVERAGVPVTVKIRSGWDDASVNARGVALCAEDAGVSALFIHGRTRTQGYGGSVDYGIIEEVKKALAIPVVGSGDNLSVLAIQKMLDETGCDGVAIARGCLGYPWICREVIRFFQDGTACEGPTLNERIATMSNHLNLVIEHYGEKRGVGCFHKFFIWYTRGLSRKQNLRDRAFRADTKAELLEVIEELHTLG